MKLQHLFQNLIFVLLMHICYLSAAQRPHSSRARSVGSVNVKYVTPAGAGLKDGSSWSNALDTLGFQPELDITLHPSEFWVAAGTYKPTYGLDQTITFQINDSVKVYGGFNGTESLLSQRDYVVNKTILDGRLGNPSDTDNVNRIVSFYSVSDQSVLDGFTLQNAYNNNPSGFPAARGGAIYIDGSNGSSCRPIIANCIMQNNQSTSGAGAYANASYNGEVGEHFINCVFRNNVSYISHGGAYRSANLNGGVIESTFENCLFENDSSSQKINQLGGGAMYIGTASSGPGGINVKLNRCRFYGNSAYYGGALYVLGNSSAYDSVIISNCEFYGNSANQGPAFMNGSANSGVGYYNLSHCIFKGNFVTDTTSLNAGAIYLGASGATYTNIDNCLITGNKAQFGGGVSLFGSYSADVDITNTTISGNNATGFGGAIGILSFNNGDSLNLNIHNSILWNNSSSIELDTTGFIGKYIINADNSIIEGGYSGTNILNANPVFVYPVTFANAPDTSGDYQLQATSPAINSGNNSFVVSPGDLLNNIRIYNTTVDMGCYEYNSTPLNLFQPLSYENDFLLYPNPASELLVIDYSFTSQERVRIKIFDLTGKEIYQSSPFINKLVIDVSRLESGVYFLQLKSEHNSAIQKFIKR